MIIDRVRGEIRIIDLLLSMWYSNFTFHQKLQLQPIWRDKWSRCGVSIALPRFMIARICSSKYIDDLLSFDTRLHQHQATFPRRTRAQQHPVNEGKWCSGEASKRWTIDRNGFICEINDLVMESFNLGNWPFNQQHCSGHSLEDINIK